jgi:AraC-like DNA-binding protein/mannose-6-phosphate isomerase-like protein (cupin superfamily)
MIFKSYKQLLSYLRKISPSEKELRQSSLSSFVNLSKSYLSSVFDHEKKIMTTGKDGVYTSVANEALQKEKIIIRQKHRFNQAGNKVMHKHDYIEGTYVLEGEYEQVINGRKIKMRAGDISFMDSNTVHSFAYLDENAIAVNILLTKDYFDGIFLELFADSNYVTNFLANSLYSQNKEQNYFILSLTEDSFTESIVKNLLVEYYSEEIRSNVTLKSLLIVLLTNISRELTSYGHSVERINYEQDKQKEEMLIYIQDHLQDWNLTDMSNHFNFHPTYLSSMVRKDFGKSLQEILIEKRLDKACTLLARTDLTVEMIMEKVGYHNKSYFYKIFREKFEMTPIQFRKKENKN